MLKVGQQVGAFSGRASSGEEISLGGLLGRPFVVYFFPKSFTTGCTIETQRFAQLYPEFEAAGVEVVGVSADELETQCDFAKSTSASFPMMGDPEGQVYEAFGLPTLNVYRRIRRVTFVVDERGTVEQVFSVGLGFGQHPQEVLDYMKARQPKA